MPRVTPALLLRLSVIALKRIHLQTLPRCVFRRNRFLPTFDLNNDLTPQDYESIANALQNRRKLYPIDCATSPRPCDISAWRAKGARVVWWLRIRCHDEFLHRTDAYTSAVCVSL